MSRGSISLAALLWLVIAFLVLYPLSILVVESFKIAETGGWGIGNYLEFFQDTYYLKTFKNTLFLSAMVLLTTTVFGVPLAYILARYRHRGKTVFTALILLPIVLPAFAGVFAFIIFFGKYGTVNLLLMEIGLVDKPVNFIYGYMGWFSFNPCICSRLSFWDSRPVSPISILLLKKPPKSREQAAFEDSSPSPCRFAPPVTWRALCSYSCGPLPTG